MDVVSEVTGWPHKTVVGPSSSQGVRTDRELGLPSHLFFLRPDQGGRAPRVV